MSNKLLILGASKVDQVSCLPENVDVQSFPGARANDSRLLNYINNLQPVLPNCNCKYRRKWSGQMERKACFTCGRDNNFLVYT